MESLDDAEAESVDYQRSALCCGCFVVIRRHRSCRRNGCWRPVSHCGLYQPDAGATNRTRWC